MGLLSKETVAHNIKYLRTKQGFTQEALANKLFISVRHMRRLETEGTSVIEVINQVAVVLGVEPITLLQ